MVPTFTFLEAAVPALAYPSRLFPFLLLLFSFRYPFSLVLSCLQSFRGLDVAMLTSKMMWLDNVFDLIKCQTNAKNIAEGSVYCF